MSDEILRRQLAEAEQNAVGVQQARRAVLSFVSTFLDDELQSRDPSCWLVELEQFSILIDREPRAIIRACEHLFTDLKGARRLVVALLICVAASAWPSTVRNRNVVDRAADALVAAAGGDIAERIFICDVMSYGVQVPGLDQAINELCDDDDEGVRIRAAAALAAVPGARPHDVVLILRRALDRMDDLDGALIIKAAGGMARLGLHVDKSLDLLVKMMAGNDAILAQSAGMMLLGLGPLAARVSSQVLEVSGNESASIAVRMRALEAYGAIAANREDSLPPIIQAIRSNVPALVCAGLDALVAHRMLPEDALVDICQQLSSKSDHVRVAATRAIFAYGNRAEMAVGALLDRIGREQSPQMLERISAALSSIGQSAAREVVSRARNGDARVWQYGPMLLSAMGEVGLNALRDAFMSVDQRDHCSNLLIYIRCLGERAAPLTSLLAEVLPTCPDDELACQVVSAIAAIGLRQEVGMDALVKCVARSEGLASSVAIEALRAAGTAAEAVILSAMEGADADVCERLSSCFSQQDVVPGLIVSRLSDAFHEKHFVRYMKLVHLLLQDSSLSLRRAVKILVDESRQRNDCTPVTYSVTAMGNAIDYMESKRFVTGPLLQRQQGRPVIVTRNGAMIYRAVTELLRRRSHI
ncbi:MAG: hypothetical protein H6832_09265 [Planctomycetes bacterium]|nr:hypothetical protein [Planctomycetota bacterium]